MIVIDETDYVCVDAQRDIQDYKDRGLCSGLSPWGLLGFTATVPKSPVELAQEDIFQRLLFQPSRPSFNFSHVRIQLKKLTTAPLLDQMKRIPSNEILEKTQPGNALLVFCDDTEQGRPQVEELEELMMSSHYSRDFLHNPAT